MTEEIKVDPNQVLPTDTEKTTEIKVVEQDPLKNELERVQRKGRSKAEKLIYTKNRIDEQLKELGVEDEPEDEDDKPVTLGMLKKLQQQTATKTALQLADEVSNETERELLKYHLENTIKSTGNPNQDFELARTLINAVKNRQIMEEAARKPEVRTHASSSGVPVNVTKPQDELTVEELSFTRPPFNLTKEQILKTRPQ